MNFDDAALRRAVRVGDLQRVRTGWYATPNAPADVVVAVRRGGVLSCASAMRHHGLWVPPRYPTVHARPSKHHASSGGDWCRPYGPPPPSRTAVDPLPVALACAGRCMCTEDWIVCCDSAVNLTGWSVAELRSVLSPMPRTLMSLLGRCEPGSQSGAETITRLRLRARGFRVDIQPRIIDVGRVDLRVGRLLIECDSKAHHTSLDNYRNDRRRDRRATVGGWLVLRITYDDVLYAWDEVLADILAITRPDRHRRRGGRDRPDNGVPR